MELPLRRGLQGVWGAGTVLALGDLGGNTQEALDVTSMPWSQCKHTEKRPHDQVLSQESKGVE